MVETTLEGRKKICGFVDFEITFDPFPLYFVLVSYKLGGTFPSNSTTTKVPAFINP
jgi:hypothetical protein